MNTSALALRSTPPPTAQNQGDTYLRFQLCQQTPAAVSMNRAQEVIVLPVTRLTPMPNMPPYVLGVMNRRSRVLWVVELAQMLGLPPVEFNGQHYNIVIIRNETAAFGLAVQAVDGVMRLLPEGVQPPRPFTSKSHSLLTRLRNAGARRFTRTGSRGHYAIAPAP